MRDIHCHILPGVDDGAADLDESLAMLEAAKRAGVTRIVCTPHCRDPYFDYDKMWDAFELLRDNADGFPLQMGFEVNHRKLVELGIDAAEHLHFDGTNEFLLELSTHADAYAFREYENTIYDLQCRGYQVIIAHPERYRAVQKDVSVAERLVDMGCKLQASADFIAGGRFGREKKPAQRLFDQNLYSFIASDAHNVGRYDCLAKGCFDDAALVRRVVFMDEQGYENEFDAIDEDQNCIHVTLYVDGELAGCSRVFPEELERVADAEAPVLPACDMDEGVAAGEAYIMGRVAVLPAMRRRGLASAIVEASASCARDAGAKLIKLHAQEYVLPLYAKAGYTQIAPVDYEDEGQPHVWMAKRVDGR